MHHSSINLQDPFCQLIPLRPLWTSPQWYPHLSSSPHSWWCPLELHPESKSTQKSDNSNATCVWHKKNGTLSKKKMLVRNPMCFFAVCPHVWKLWHTHITGWKPLRVHLSTKCPRHPLRSTRSRTKDLLPFRRSPSPWFPAAESWRKNQLGRRGAHIAIVWNQLHAESWKSMETWHPIPRYLMLHIMYVLAH